MLRFKRKLILDIYDYSGNKLCPLYDSRSDVSGQATDVFVKSERNGWKELSFKLQKTIDTETGMERNFRLDYLKADYAIRLEDDKEVDWYLISEPRITHNGFANEVEVVAGHVAMLLKQKNLTLVFSDEEGNSVGTPTELLNEILKGTGWYPGKVCVFYEDNGVDIKRRSLICDEKTGSFKMISDMCELFEAKPVYHGESYPLLTEDPGDMDTNYAAYCTLTNGEYVQLTAAATYQANTYYRYKVRTVDILPMNPFSIKGSNGLPTIFQTDDLVNSSDVIELNYSVNLSNVSRTLNTENIVTKLYAYGSYGDKTDGYCSIGECKHTEFTYTAAVDLNVGDYGLFKYTDSAGEHHGRFLVSGKPVETGDVLIFSTLDAASKMYMYNNTKEYAYFCDKEYDGTYVTLDGEPDEETEIINESNFIMDFTYYHGIGLFTESMLQSLAKNQRKAPELRQIATEASAAFNDKESALSETIGNSDYLRLAPASLTPYVRGDNDLLKINLNTDEYPDGVMYRSDYYENEANYFKWHSAPKLKSNGDPVYDNASVIYLVHGTSPIQWEKTYIKTINDIEAYENDTMYHIGDHVTYAGSFYECTAEIAANEDHEWNSAHWRLITDLKPTSITVWLPYSEHTTIGDDEIFLFKSNTVNGILGKLESQDEGIIETIENIEDTLKKHSVFFVSKDDLVDGKPNIPSSQIDEYAWCWVFDPDDDAPIDERSRTDIGWYGQNINGHTPSSMWFFNQTVQDLPAGQWCPVFFSDDEEPIPYPYTYWYDWRNGKAYYAKEVQNPGIVVTEETFKTVRYIYDQHVYDVWSDMVKTYSDNVVANMSDSDKENILVAVFPSVVDTVTEQVVKDYGTGKYYIWEQFNTNDTASKTQERIGSCMGAIWHQCRDRDRCYQGDYMEYLYTAPTGGLEAGRYAFKTPYGDYFIMSIDHDMAAGDTLLYNSSDGYIIQHIASGQDAGEYSIEIKSVKFDSVKYHPTNVLDGVIFETGSINEDNGTELVDNDTYRSSYAKVYGGLEYTYDGGEGDPVAIVFVYNAKKVYQDEYYYVGGTNQDTFSIELEVGDTGYIRVVTDDEGYEDFRIYHPGYRSSIIQNDESYQIIPFYPQENSELKSIPRYITVLRDYSDELYLELMPTKKEAQDAVTALDYELAHALGDIYREGYWQDSNYVDGDEDRLYADAAENLEQISRPEASYDITFHDLYGSNEHDDFAADNTVNVPWPDLSIAYAAHLVDPEISIDEWAYVDEINKCYDQPWKTEIKINTDLTTIAQHSFADVLENIANVAKKLNGKQTMYDKAVIGSGTNGSVTAERLEGEIDLNRLRISGAGSSMQTDAKGNLLFEDVNGDGAMKLTGAGFAIASSKNADGDWIWRTFGTGSGFTADMITTGFLSADRIQAGSISVDKIENGLGAMIDLSNNSIIMAVQVGKYDKFNGIVIDEDGVRLTTELCDDVEYVLLRQKPSDWDNHSNSYYIRQNNTYVHAPSGATFAASTYYKQVNKGAMIQNIVSLSKHGIELASNSDVIINSGSGIYIASGGTFTVSSSNFVVDTMGNVEITGAIHATGGTIDGNVIIGQDAKIAGTVEATSGKVGGFTIANNMLYHSDAETSRHIYLDGTGGLYAMWAGLNEAEITDELTSTTTYAPFSVTKTGLLRANNAIISGDITATTGHIGGWEIDSSGFMHAGSTSNYVALDPRQDVAPYTYPYAIWAGAENPEEVDANTNETVYAPFSVKKNGLLRATNAVIEGDITATTGHVGGWEIDSTGFMHAGSTSTYIALDPRQPSGNNTYPYAMWAGAASPSTYDAVSNTTTYAPFCVTKAGAVYASSGYIGTPSAGFAIGASNIKNGMTSLSDTTHNGVYIGTDGIALGKGAFKVTNGGSGNIGGWNFNGTRLYGSYKISNTTYTAAIDPAASSTSGYYVFSLYLNGATVPMPNVLSPSSTVASYYAYGVKNDGTVETTKLVAESVIAGEINAGDVSAVLMKSDDLEITDTIALPNVNSPTVVISSTAWMGGGTIQIHGGTGGIYCTSLSATSSVGAASVSTTGNIAAGGTVTAGGAVVANHSIRIIPDSSSENVIHFGSGTNAYPRLIISKNSSNKLVLRMQWASGSSNWTTLSTQP